MCGLLCLVAGSHCLWCGGVCDGLDGASKLGSSMEPSCSFGVGSTLSGLGVCACCFFDFWFWHLVLFLWIDRPRLLKFIGWNAFGASKGMHRFDWGRPVLRPAGARWPSWWLVWLVFGASLRIGEASLPGPVNLSDVDHTVPEVVFRLGTCNPNGISDKAHFFRDSGIDIMAVTETHLTGRGLKCFRGMLKTAAPQFKWFVHGKCVLPRGQVSDTGMWSGVGVMSQWPTHGLPHDWSPVVFETGRICVASTFIHGLWISGCVVYGTPCGPTHPQAKNTTNALIREAFRRVLQLSGPRYVCGDFNHDAAQLEAVLEMKRAGFVDLQDLHLERAGIPPSATCRGKTRRDFCFVSPELVPMFHSCQVLDFDWSDHSSVVGVFSCAESDRWRFPWPLPDPIDWKSLPPRSEGELVDFMTASSPSEAYATFWSQVENEAVRVSLDTPSPLSHRCLGRGSRSAPLATKFQVAPIRASRNGDIKPSYLGLSQQHRQWFRQLRRLESYKRMVRRWTSQSDSDHRVDLWNSIVGAAGFRPSFAGWWKSTGGLSTSLSVFPETPRSLNF